MTALELPVFRDLAHVGEIPVTDLGGDSRRKAGGIEKGRITYARFTGEKSLPDGLTVGAQGRDHADAGNHHASSHGFTPWGTSDCDPCNCYRPCKVVLAE